jgi:hypothetical protein
MRSLVSAAFDYQLFGLTVRSDIALPELYRAERQGDPDVTVRLGEVEARPAKPDIHADGTTMFLTIPGVARYRVDAGHEILVDPEPGAPDRNLRLFLLGSAFGALLHQRALLPLHANAVEIDGKAVAFMGPSGSGKSTLAASFHALGFPLIADDVSVVGFAEDGRPYATLGPPRLRLWAEALESIGGQPSDYDRSYADNGEPVDKFDIPIGRGRAASSTVELDALYLLERGDEFSINEITGVEAAEAVFANTYRGSYLSMLKGQKDHWQSAVRLVRSVPVYRAVRQWDLTKLEDQSRRLLAHAAGCVTAGTDGSS